MARNIYTTPLLAADALDDVARDGVTRVHLIIGGTDHGTMDAGDAAIAARVAGGIFADMFTAGNQPRTSVELLA